eukprot:CAMPEP_0172487078 /NCGR_PEP_ID=MMETSP1066-20121228/15966_1 /TAXON_ID=671091 /ORGANISM="Coscinodiscus wailesii, Strain CCMP2513" /LENGTH=570 /DNA_ID=CAMNT_0013253469 /DNA_START=60 /DNA_END=1772 /DNA_ORIENTATION=-
MNEASPLLDRNDNQAAIAYAAVEAKIMSDRGDASETLPVAHAEDTPSYAVLNHYGLLTTEYRKMHFDDLFEGNDLKANSSLSKNCMKRCMYGYYCVPIIGRCCYTIFNTEVIVPAGHVSLFTDSDHNYIFAQPGVHNINGIFMKNIRSPVSVMDEVISHGNRTIVTIPQGMLGYASDKGQPVLLPPGLHSWKSDTLQFKRSYSLDDHVIEVGPYTIVTVDEGYAAITQDNGKQKILSGGETHLLSHQKWKFEKFMTLKIQTDDLERIRAVSADNITMSVNSTVVWRIRDVKIAARLASETMSTGGRSLSADITKLRKDVLKQAIASLASFIGSVNYSDSFHIAAAAQRKLAIADAKVVTGPDVPIDNAPVSKGVENPLFDADGMSDAVAHANSITSAYGVEICSINIISANPDDPSLTSSLSTGAVASAAALQAETAARGKAKAMKIEAEATAITMEINANAEAKSSIVAAETYAKSTTIKAEAEGKAEIIKADGAKQAEILRAEGAIKAAALLEESNVAVDLERIKQSALALNGTDKFFFGREPEYMSNIVMNAVETSAIMAQNNKRES